MESTKPRSSFMDGLFAEPQVKKIYQPLDKPLTKEQMQAVKRQIDEAFSERKTPEECAAEAKKFVEGTMKIIEDIPKSDFDTESD